MRLKIYKVIYLHLYAINKWAEREETFHTEIIAHDRNFNGAVAFDRKISTFCPCPLIPRYHFHFVAFSTEKDECALCIFVQ